MLCTVADLQCKFRIHKPLYANTFEGLPNRMHPKPEKNSNKGWPFWWHARVTRAGVTVGLRRLAWLIEVRGLANRSEGLGLVRPVMCYLMGSYFHPVALSLVNISQQLVNISQQFVNISQTLNAKSWTQTLILLLGLDIETPVGFRH